MHEAIVEDGAMMDDAEARSEKNLTGREQDGYEVITPLVAAA